MLFDDGFGGGTRRHDLASRVLADDEERPIGFEDLVRLSAKSNGPRARRNRRGALGTAYNSPK
jgi:hypothetical protein